MKYALILLAALVLAGCSSTPAVVSAAPQPQPCVDRFQPFNDLAGIALDTKTGRLCKTYDWHSTAKNVVVPSPYEHAPLCVNLSNDPLGIR